MTEDNKNDDTALGNAFKDAGYKSEGGEIGKRGPGRPPKTTAGANNTADAYKPSVERNTVDQALQPTGRGEVAGLGANEAFGGKGDHDGDGEAGGSVKWFPVLLKRNYRPIHDTGWKIIKNDGSYAPAPRFDEGTSPKAQAGFKIALPIEEAKAIIAKGIAERADEIK